MLVRHFGKERIRNFCRNTIGTTWSRWTFCWITSRRYWTRKDAESYHANGNNQSKDQPRRDIALSLDLDGAGKSEIDSGVGFLDHMLTLFARQARVDLTLRCAGDTRVDDHHSVEDIGIALGGGAKNGARGEKRGIVRYGSMLLRDGRDARALRALDLSGRGYLRYTANIPSQKVGAFDTELIQEFFPRPDPHGGRHAAHQAARRRKHDHIIEAMFKAFGRAPARRRRHRRGVCKTKSPPQRACCDMNAIVDYGVGNLFSLKSSLSMIGAEAMVTGSAEDLRAAEKIILPGVGAFEDAANKLRATGLDAVVTEQAQAGKPLLGICTRHARCSLIAA